MDDGQGLEAGGKVLEKLQGLIASKHVNNIRLQQEVM